MSEHPARVIRQLTDKEWIIVILLANAWNEFLTLPNLSASDKTEFMQYIHSAQQAVAARNVFDSAMFQAVAQGAVESIVTMNEALFEARVRQILDARFS